MTYLKKGFTLLEIIIVLSLIGIFIVGSGYLTRDVRINQTNAERLANTIYDTIRGARNNMVIGRGVFTGGSMVVTKQREILISNTGITTTFLYATSGTGTEFSLPRPFFDKDSVYQITNIAVSSGGLSGTTYTWDYNAATNAKIIINPNSDITISANNGGSPITYPSPITIRTLKITAGYGGFEQSVIIDRVTGTVELKKSHED